MIERHQEAALLRSLAEAYQEIVEMGRALGKAGGSAADDNVKGAEARVSSGSGITLTPAAGLGKDKPKGSDKTRAKKYNKQAAEDRKAAARERAEMRKAGIKNNPLEAG